MHKYKNMPLMEKQECTVAKTQVWHWTTQDETMPLCHLTITSFLWASVSSSVNNPTPYIDCGNYMRYCMYNIQNITSHSRCSINGSLLYYKITFICNKSTWNSCIPFIQIHQLPTLSIFLHLLSMHVSINIHISISISGFTYDFSLLP